MVCFAVVFSKAGIDWLELILGVQCPYGDKCCWGHVCPNGPKCFHLSKGKCWFKGGTLNELFSGNELTATLFVTNRGDAS